MSAKHYSVAAAGLASGIIFYDRPYVCLAICFVALLISAFSANKDKALLVIFISILLLGVFRVESENRLIDTQSLPSETVFVNGTVNSQPKIKDGNASFFLKASSVNGCKTAAYFWVNSRGFKGVFGDNLKFSARASTAGGSFNDYLRSKRTKYILNVEGQPEIRPTALSAIGRVRGRVAGLYAKNDTEGMLLASLIGDKGNLSAQAASDLKSSGLAHIWAVSGLHVGCLLVFILGICRLCGLRSFLQVAFGIIALCFYALVTGLNPPVVRSALMGTVVLVGWFMGRKRDTASIILLVFISMLLYDPLLLAEAGFQLSFSAVFGIIALSKPMTALLWDWPAFLKESVAVSLSAQAATLPVLAYHFGSVPVYGSIANAFAVPLVLPMMAFNFAYVLLNRLPGALILKNAACLIAGVIIKTASLVSSLPFSRLYLEKPIIAIFLLMIITGGFLIKKYKISLVTALIVLLSVILAGCLVQTTENTGGTTVTFLDVGQGDSALIKDGSDTILIDGGPDYDLVADKLSGQGINDIDIVVLTHPHADHITGLLKIIRKFKIGLVVNSGYAHPSFMYKDFLEQIKADKVKYLRAKAGRELKLGAFDIQIFHPGEELLSGTGSDENNNSVVMKIKAKNTTVLFTGDIEREAEELILSQKFDLSADILKVAHHGSGGSSSEEFLRAVGAKTAIISAGKENPYGHPSAMTLARLKKARYNVYRTDTDGTLTVSIEEQRFIIKK